MRKPITCLLILCCISISVSAQHQDTQKEPPFITLMELGVGTTSLELGLSGRVGDNFAIGLMAMGFHNSNFTDIKSNYLIGAKSKFYIIDMRPEPYVGFMVGAHGFGNDIHPMVGINAGFDIYAGENFYEDKILTRLGLDFGVGIDDAGNSFFGATVSFGLGLIRGNSEPYSYR